MKKKIRATIQAQPKPSINDWFRYIYAEANKGKGLTPERLGKTTNTSVK